MDNTKQKWTHYCEDELAILEPLLHDHGYKVEEKQPNLRGERFLQQAVTTRSGTKLILFCKTHEGQKVIIKATRDNDGKQELKHERQCRELLAKIDFAAEAFHLPKEIAMIEAQNFFISVQEFVEQPKTFLAHTLEEQFNLALRAFKAQEGAHATTFKHRRLIKKAYEMRDTKTYLNNFTRFINETKNHLPEETELIELLTRTKLKLESEQTTIEQYCGFLTHTDFVPHNLRLDKNSTMYLLDHSSLAFGNKYEGWARFLNFMTLYNPPLTKLLTEYVANNRTAEESDSLWLMRLYRLGEIIFYYSQAQSKSDGDLKNLNLARVAFWGNVLECTLRKEEVPEEIVTEYQNTRDSLRSEDEKERQQDLH